MKILGQSIENGDLLNASVSDIQIKLKYIMCTNILFDIVKNKLNSFFSALLKNLK